MAQFATVAEHRASGLTCGLPRFSVVVFMRALRPLLFCLLPAVACAAEGEWTAAKLAAQLSSLIEDGDSTARVRLTSSGGESLQVRIKSRRNGQRAETAYEILWPAPRKGEGLALRQSGGSVTGTARAASGQTAKLSEADLSKPVFGTALAHADIVGNFFRWSSQSLAGTEKVGNTECLVLESRPGQDDATIYAKVKSYVDPRRMVVMRVEKYDNSGRMVRLVETTRVAKDDRGKDVPAAMTVRAGENTTEVDGSNIRHDVAHTAADFEW